MQPAQKIIMRLGGEALVSEIAGVSLTTPYRWTYPREAGGTGGTIPQKHHRTLLDYARRRGIRLEAADFLPPPLQRKDRRLLAARRRVRV